MHIFSSVLYLAEINYPLYIYIQFFPTLGCYMLLAFFKKFLKKDIYLERFLKSLFLSPMGGQGVGGWCQVFFLFSFLLFKHYVIFMSTFCVYGIGYLSSPPVPILICTGKKRGGGGLRYCMYNRWAWGIRGCIIIIL